MIYSELKSWIQLKTFFEEKVGNETLKRSFVEWRVIHKDRRFLTFVNDTWILLIANCFKNLFAKKINIHGFVLFFRIKNFRCKKLSVNLTVSYENGQCTSNLVLIQKKAIELLRMVFSRKIWVTALQICNRSWWANSAHTHVSKKDFFQ